MESEDTVVIEAEFQEAVDRLNQAHTVRPLPLARRALMPPFLPQQVQIGELKAQMQQTMQIQRAELVHQLAMVDAMAKVELTAGTYS